MTTMTRKVTTIEGEVLDLLVGKTVQVYLINGKALVGVLRRHDDRNLLIDGRREKDPPSLVYKSQLSTIHEYTG